jgi:hypothetical protein
MLVSHMLNRLIRVGSLSTIDAYGHTHFFKVSEGPAVTVRLTTRLSTTGCSPTHP